VAVEVEREEMYTRTLKKDKVDVQESFVFFQAVDGIRGRNVTGVQTCALPILLAAIENSGRDEFIMVGGAGSANAIREIQSGDSEIGRASCRERGEVAVRGGAARRKHSGDGSKGRGGAARSGGGRRYTGRRRGT